MFALEGGPDACFKCRQKRTLKSKLGGGTAKRVAKPAKASHPKNPEPPVTREGVSDGNSRIVAPLQLQSAEVGQAGNDVRALLAGPPGSGCANADDSPYFKKCSVCKQVRLRLLQCGRCRKCAGWKRDAKNADAGVTQQLALLQRGADRVRPQAGVGESVYLAPAKPRARSREKTRKPCANCGTRERMSGKGQTWCAECREVDDPIFEPRIGNQDYEINAAGQIQPKAIERVCLRCNQRFTGYGRFNRMCSGCNGTNSNASAAARYGSA